jgi:hypothetical protein
MMTAEALDGIAHDVNRLAVPLEGRLNEGTEIDDLENAGIDLQALQTKIAEDTDTAAIDTVKIVIVIGMVNGHREDIGARDDDLALPNDSQAPRHWSDAVHFLRKTMHSQTR